MKRLLLLLLCLSAAVRPAAAQTAVSGFVCSLPERLARPLDDTLVVLRDLELLAPRRVMQSFDVVSDSRTTFPAGLAPTRSTSSRCGPAATRCPA